MIFHQGSESTEGVKNVGVTELAVAEGFIHFGNQFKDALLGHAVLIRIADKRLVGCTDQGVSSPGNEEKMAPGSGHGTHHVLAGYQLFGSNNMNAFRSAQCGAVVGFCCGQAKHNIRPGPPAVDDNGAFDFLHHSGQEIFGFYSGNLVPLVESETFHTDMVGHTGAICDSRLDEGQRQTFRKDAVAVIVNGRPGKARFPDIRFALQYGPPGDGSMNRDSLAGIPGVILVVG
ncbi:MAG: hypothetical protein BWX99_03017 [Deltaproteobacteria bacterium ADurb.Bin151]|nr:MAG: hypothetical protein BWX99_03017 [Deltaproteobacteria bacterium ADurb.Bin151]